MKKILVMLAVAAVLCAALCACGTKAATKEPTLEDLAVKKMESKVLGEIWDKYGFVNADINTTTVTQVDDYKFEMWGKVTVTDNYGDRYSGKFNGTVYYYSTLDEFSVSCEVGKLLKT